MRRIVIAVVTSALLVGCGLAGAGMEAASPGSGALAHAQQASDTLKSAGCMVSSSALAASPLTASWPKEQQAALDQAMPRAIVVVKYDACGIKILEHCKVEGGYRFVGTELASRDVTIDDQATLAEHIFGEYGDLAAKVKGGQKLALKLTAVGSLEATKAIVLPTSLTGDCEGATHYVSAALVGSHLIRTASAADAGSSDPLDGERVPASCAETKPGSKTAPAGCDHKVQVQLAPVRSIEVPATRQHDRAACPDDNPRDCTMACLRANMSACTTLAWMLEEGHNVPEAPERAAMLYRGACFAGQQLACNNLAIQYMQGRGVEKDESQAAPLLRMACSGGFTRACANLGTLYRDGVGVDKDPPRAVSLFQRACDAHDGEACGMLGRMISTGVGAPRDIAVAATAFTHGCTLRDADSCNNLAVHMLDAVVGQRNEAAAARMFSIACTGGLAIACRNLGMLNLNGLGVSRDPERATAAFDKACSLGADDACERLGSLYAAGKDATKGFSLLDEACKHSSADGCSRLAALYEEGRGVARDPAKAFGLLKQACEGGAASACERIADVSRKAGKIANAPSSWLDPLCGKGQQSACTAVADLLAHKDPAGAASRYLRACDAGETAACARGARLLIGMPKPSVESATRMFQRACDAGDGASCADLAQRYIKGDHVPKDAARGTALLEAACLIPDARSCQHAAEIYEHGKGADAQPSKAQSFYQRACQAGAAPGCAKAASLPAAPPPPDPLGAAGDPKGGTNAPPSGEHGK